MPQVGFLSAGSRQPWHSEFERGLRDAGYTPGKDISVEYRYAEGQAEQLPGMAHELLSSGVDVIVAADSQAIEAARSATTTVPIVMGVTADPVKAGYVQSLARPGGNITGLSILGLDTSVKRIEILKRLFPTASRIGAIVNPSNPLMPRQLADSQAAGESIGVEVLPLPVNAPEDIDTAFQTAADQQVDALLMIGDPMFAMERDHINDLLLYYRIPAMVNPENIEAGGVVSYAPSVAGLLYQSAAYVDKILKGSKPSDLPVEQPTRFELVINRRMVQSLGIEIPDEVLTQVDRFID